MTALLKCLHNLKSPLTPITLQIYISHQLTDLFQDGQLSYRGTEGACYGTGVTARPG